MASEVSIARENSEERPGETRMKTQCARKLVEVRPDFDRTILTLERRVDEGHSSVAFSMFPTTVRSLMTVADAGSCMPPKSTWFEPKLRSGLFVYEF